MYKQRKSVKIVFIIVLGIVLATLLGIIAFIMVSQSSGKLSYEKMKENVEPAEKLQQEDTENTTENEFYTKNIKAFDVNKDSDSSSKEKDTESDDSYLCSYSSERLITDEDIERIKKTKYDGIPKGKDILQMVINEMYAKYGYKFKSEEIQAYFDSKEWYRNIKSYNSNMDDIYSEMTDLEKDNINFLNEHKEGE